MAALRLFVEANVVCTPHQSGVGYAARKLITTLVRDGEAQRHLRVVLIVPLRGRAQLRRIGLDDVERVAIPLPLRGYDRWAASPLLPPLDAVYGSGAYLFPNYGNWPLLRARSLTIMHDVAFLRFPDTVEERTGARLRHNARRWARRTSVVLTPSNFTRDELSTCLGLEHERIVVMPLGVDHDVFFPRPLDDVDVTLRRLGLPAAYILYFGNIEPRKNLARLVRAYSRVDPVVQRAYPLVLAGTGSWRAEEIEREIARAQALGYPVIRLTGRINDADVPALISGASLLAHPSIYEGFGLVPLQAMACGTPVLVSNRASMPEVAGDAGFYVDPLDEGDITRGIVTVLSDDTRRASMISSGLRRASAFTWKRAATVFLSALQSVDV